ncbi:putative prolyl 4-hydroxylase 7 [Capsicum annuum]|nr:putative prolyl 4-hydroxylase 7 [Capsicum annuum]
MDAPVRRCERLALDGFRRGRGRPKKYWGEVIRRDMEQLQLTEDMTLDRKFPGWNLRTGVEVNSRAEFMSRLDPRSKVGSRVLGFGVETRVGVQIGSHIRSRINILDHVSSWYWELGFRILGLGQETSHELGYIFGSYVGSRIKISSHMSSHDWKSKYELRPYLSWICCPMHLLVSEELTIPNFILFFGQSKEECEYLINLGKPHMKKSTVVDSATGKSTDSRVRTSSGTFLDRGQDKVVKTIEKRIADFTFIPVEHGEGLQILHYEVGQKYEPHYDYFSDEFNTVNGGQRIATVLMYLSDVEEGGETVFPAAKGNFSEVPWWNELSECGKGGLSVKPKMGDALLFWSMRPDATLDPSSLHGGCPVIKGNKWSSTKWMRVHEYNI